MQILTKTAAISKLDEEILLVTLLENDDTIDLEEAKAHYNGALQLTGGKKMKVLVDATASMHEMNSEAQQYIAENPNKIAEAILVKQIHQRIIATFYFKFVSKIKDHPVKVFTNKQEAIDWLREQK